MDSVEDTVQRFWQLPHRWRSGYTRDDQVFSQLHLLHPKDLNDEANLKVNAELIFVAGLGGHYRETWRALDGTIWPQDLLHLEHYGIENVRVWSFEYNTSLRAPHMKLDSGTETGGKRQSGAETNYLCWTQPWGMLIKKAILIAETEDNFKILWHAIRGAMFFAVPHHGLDRADWKNFVTLVLKANAPVPGIRPTLVMEKQAAANGEALLGITHDFRRLQEFLFFVNYTEGRLMRGLTAPLIAEGRGWMDAPRKFELQLDGDHLGICKFEKRNPGEQITGGFEVVVSHLKHLMGASKALEHIGDKASAAIESLCPTGFHGYFMAKQATVGTCGWIAEKKAFRDWVGNDKESRMLWIQGPPASGKSFLTRHIITDLIPPSTTQKVAHCFLDDSVPGRRRLEHLLRATLHHALRVEPELIHHYLVPPYLKAVEASDTGVPDDEIWTLEVLLPIWPEVVAKVTSRGVLTVVVDGFSEMSLDCQQGFLDCLEDFKINKAESQEQRDRLKVLLVSREDAEVDEQLEVGEEFEVLKITPEDVREDIEKTVMAAVTDVDNWDGQDSAIARQHLAILEQDQVEVIRDTIVSTSGGNFLLAKMKAQAVSESLVVDTPDTTMALVEELPNDIAGMYDETLRRVQEDSTYLPFVKHILRWATFQMEPIKEAELNTAIALGMAHDQASTGQVSKEKLESLQKLVGSTRSLIEKHARQLVEIREGTLQPVDPLLKERLTNPSSDDLECMEEGPSHAALASTCLSYLTMEYFQDSHKPMAASVEEKVKKRIEDHAFSRYAALHWRDHVEAAGSAWQEVDDHVTQSQKLLEDDTTHYGISSSEIRWFLTRRTMEGYKGYQASATTAETTPNTPMSDLQSLSVVGSPSQSPETSYDEADDAPHIEVSGRLSGLQSKLGKDVPLQPQTQHKGIEIPEAQHGKVPAVGESALGFTSNLTSSRGVNQEVDVDVDGIQPRVEVPFEPTTGGLEFNSTDAAKPLDKQETVNMGLEKTPEFPWQVQTPESKGPIGLGLFERDVQAIWKPEDIGPGIEPGLEASEDSRKPLEPYLTAEEIELSTEPTKPEPLTAPQHDETTDKVIIENNRDFQDREASADLERRHEPGSFYDRLQRHPSLLDPVLQGPYLDLDQQQLTHLQEETAPQQSLPLSETNVVGIEDMKTPENSTPEPSFEFSTVQAALKYLSPERFIEPQSAELAPEVIIRAPKVAIPTHKFTIPTLHEAFLPMAAVVMPTPTAVLPTPKLGFPTPDVTLDPVDYPRRPEENSTKTPLIREGHKTKTNAVQLSQPKQIPKFDYQVSRSHPTTSTSNDEGHGTIGTATPTRTDQTRVRASQDQPRNYFTPGPDAIATPKTNPQTTWVSDIPTRHPNPAAAGPVIPKGNVQVWVRDSRDQDRHHHDAEADDDEQEEDSEPAESVLGDTTGKKKKRSLFKRAVDKTKKASKKIVKGVTGGK
ncbi:hypothetical protein B0T21DRAFT_454314 [Apiosordaria backusii]|uniref:Nephrocystin 3-like N-terminal domain-containing protein n=1 Tax=Apiosordaria backusii TaxID=314023 RepID=A0AA40AIL2_9PEZI|nr:hypothetical protein B0T21DRAFT_454314 [Apiosordaria backusii]